MSSSSSSTTRSTTVLSVGDVVAKQRTDPNFSEWLVTYALNQPEYAYLFSENALGRSQYIDALAAWDAKFKKDARDDSERMTKRLREPEESVEATLTPAASGTKQQKTQIIGFGVTAITPSTRENFVGPHPPYSLSPTDNSHFVGSLLPNVAYAAAAENEANHNACLDFMLKRRTKTEHMLYLLYNYAYGALHEISGMELMRAIDTSQMFMANKYQTSHTQQNRNKMQNSTARFRLFFLLISLLHRHRSEGPINFQLTEDGPFYHIPYLACFEHVLPAVLGITIADPQTETNKTYCADRVREWCNTKVPADSSVDVPKRTKPLMNEETIKKMFTILAEGGVQI